MKVELKSKKEIIDDEEITIWQLDKNDGAIVITINKLFDDTICECDWLDDKHKFLQVMYSDWDSNELFAIVNTDGEIIRDAIRSVEEYIEKPQLFIVEMSGFGLGSEASEHDLSADDWKMAVINRYGEFVIEPIYPKIYFEDEESTFYADNYTGEKIKYSVDGKKV